MEEHSSLRVEVEVVRIWVVVEVPVVYEHRRLQTYHTLNRRSRSGTGVREVTMITHTATRVVTVPIVPYRVRV